MTAEQQLPPHGSLSRHKYHGCKCQTCYDGYRAWQRTRHRKRGYGTWQPYVDAEPIRQHLLKLQEQGIGSARVAEAAGLYPPTVAGFLYSTGLSRPVKKRATREVAEKILAVTAETVTPGVVDATGTRRRLQALAAVGWPMKTLGPYIGVCPPTVARLTRQERVYAHTADAVAACYLRLQSQVPEGHGVTVGSARRMRNRAAAEGWPDPAWWEDWGGIDDPAAPERESSERAHEAARTVAAEVRHLGSFGVPPEEIAARVGRSESYVKEQLAGRRGPGWRAQQQGAAA